ncbi:MAG: UDP-N-acetylmuramoyl-L-alanine--D-glutamate ligase [Pseudomonadota bacterium]
MQINELKDKNIVIWGTGQEGIAASTFIKQHFPDANISFVDEATPEASNPSDLLLLKNGYPVIYGDSIASALSQADVVIKSPGVSLYHPLIQNLINHRIPVTSLLDLWFPETIPTKTICVTGTKGKSTTSSLLVHILNKLGQKSIVVGNIGAPVSEANLEGLDIIVIEVSSYQAANFESICDIGVLTSLYPEHLDWHQSEEQYYKDKLNLLKHSRSQIIQSEACKTIKAHHIELPNALLSNTTNSFHTKNHSLYYKDEYLGEVRNTYLARQHNLQNLCTVLTTLHALGVDARLALEASFDFQGLPHRQHELGERNTILYVDDSISTTPQSAIAAMEAYREKNITLIAGGYDRGLDYTPLTNYIETNNILNIICMGPSGQRIAQLLAKTNALTVYITNSMQEAVNIATKVTPPQGVILLSPAAPSYGLFKNFMERGKYFAQESGF